MARWRGGEVAATPMTSDHRFLCYQPTTTETGTSASLVTSPVMKINAGPGPLTHSHHPLVAGYMSHDLWRRPA